MDSKTICKPIPSYAGIGLRHKHFEDILSSHPHNDFPKNIWMEVHTENYLGSGGLPHHYLKKITDIYPISFHGVGLSLGSTDGICNDHIGAIKKAIDDYNPGLISEHLSWSVHGNTYFNDLLPLPYTDESLDIIAENIDKVQSYIGRSILIENPSVYIQFLDSPIDEVNFIHELIKRTGCGFLYDINNTVVNEKNYALCAEAYQDNVIKYLSPYIGEIHLAGHYNGVLDGKPFSIDNHGTEVCNRTWALFERFCQYTKNIPTLIEWDANLPPLDKLLKEAEKANHIMDQYRENKAA